MKLINLGVMIFLFAFTVSSIACSKTSVAMETADSPEIPETGDLRAESPAFKRPRILVTGKIIPARSLALHLNGRWRGYVDILAPFGDSEHLSTWNSSHVENLLAGPWTSGHATFLFHLF
jgi:hypothetical protein